MPIGLGQSRTPSGILFYVVVDGETDREELVSGLLEAKRRWYSNEYFDWMVLKNTAVSRGYICETLLMSPYTFVMDNTRLVDVARVLRTTIIDQTFPRAESARQICEHLAHHPVHTMYDVKFNNQDLASSPAACAAVGSFLAAARNGFSEMEHARQQRMITDGVEGPFEKNPKVNSWGYSRHISLHGNGFETLEHLEPILTQLWETPENAGRDKISIDLRGNQISSDNVDRIVDFVMSGKSRVSFLYFHSLSATGNSSVAAYESKKIFAEYGNPRRLNINFDPLVFR